MSTLKRSNSSSHIPRLSRLAVRQSNTGRTSRSSSARPSHTNPNLLTVYGSGTMGRSSSYSNLYTPLRITVPATPSSTASSASKNVRMNDKEWQRIQFARVKRFFADHHPDVAALKPLSIRVYIQSMDSLFKHVDSRISITLENYKDSVPDYLKSFKYPYNIKPSVVKTPAVPSSWQYILQTWIWLIDLIEVLQKPEKSLLPQDVQIGTKLFYAGVNYMGDRYVAFNNASDESIVDKDFVDNLAQIYDVNLSDTETSEHEHQLDENIQSLKEAETSIKAKIQDTRQKLDELRKSNAARIQSMHDRRSELLDKIKALRIKDRNIQLEYHEGVRRMEELQTVIAAQTCTKVELKQLREKFVEAREAEKIRQRCIEKQNQMTEDCSVKIKQQKSLIKSVVLKTNNKIAISSCKAPELQGLRMPDEDIDSPSYKKHLQRFSTKMQKLHSDLSLKLEDLKSTYNKKQFEHKMISLENEQIDAKLEKVSKAEKEQLDFQNKQKNSLYEQIRIVQLNIAEKEEELEQLIQKRPDLNEIKREYEASVERLQNMERLQKVTMIKAARFFTSLQNTFTGTIDKTMGYMSGINDVIEESTKFE